MRHLLPALLPLSLLAGCAGNAIDYWKPKTSIVGGELKRFGLNETQSSCVGNSLTQSLSVWQLRQLARGAGSVERGYIDPSRLQMADLLWIAKNVKDLTVGVEVERAAQSCGLSGASSTLAAANPAPVEAIETPVQQPEARKTGTTAWINLGAAPTRQSIAVDAQSLEEGSGYRQGWFRITDPGQSAPSSNSYLLRVDCTARTINPMALRKHGPTGAMTEQKDYGANGEGALPVEAGTVMEIAYLAMCA